MALPQGAEQLKVVKLLRLVYARSFGQYSFPFVHLCSARNLEHNIAPSIVLTPREIIASPQWRAGVVAVRKKTWIPVHLAWQSRVD